MNISDNRLINSLLTFQEVAFRQIYWRAPPWARNMAKGRNQKVAPSCVVDRAQLRSRLLEWGVRPGALVLVHSSVQGLALPAEDGGGPPVDNPWVVASALLDNLISLVGPEGTLVMPTQPLFLADPGYMFNNKDNLILDYDPVRTPCNSGLMNELFRRCPGCLRSLHPLNTLSAMGPRSSWLFADNLNRSKPLPHGVSSSYYKISQANGLVVSIGVPLYKRLTILHVPEDLRDGEWPVENFTRERRFRIRIEKEWDEWTVRERRPEFARCIAEERFRRDMLREGILHENTVEGVRVDWAKAEEIVSFGMKHNKGGTYPYFSAHFAWPYT